VVQISALTRQILVLRGGMKSLVVVSAVQIGGMAMFAGNAHTHLADLFHLVMETLYSLIACSIHGVRGTNLVSGYLPPGSLTLPNSASPSSPKCSLQLQVIIAASVKTMLYDSGQESL
jgi:hypothetical protein